MKKFDPWRRTMLVVVCLAAALAALFLVFEGRGSKPKPNQETKVEVKDVYTDADFAAYEVLPGVCNMKELMSGLIGFGETGSGKSTGAFRTALYRSWKHPSKPATLVLVAKPEVYEETLELATLAGRGDQVVDLAKERIDILDTALKLRGSVLDASSILKHVIEADAKRSSKGDDGSNRFFYDAADRVCHAATAILYHATGSASISGIYEMVTDQKAAEEHIKLGLSKKVDDDDWNAAVTLFRGEWKSMGDRQKSAVLGVAINSIGKFLRSGFSTTFSSGVTTWTPWDADAKGLISVANWPLMDGEGGRLGQIALKILVQKYALMRRKADHPRPFVIAADELQLFALPENDAYVQAVCRDRRLISLCMTQNIPLLRAAVGGEDARDEVDALIANHGVKVIACNSDPETNRWASGLCGSHWVDVQGGGVTPGGYSPERDMRGQDQGAGAHLHWNANYRPCLDPEAFTQLHRGGDGWVQTVVYQTGRVYPSTGRPWTYAWFNQNEGA
ncbi:MAG: hypothetical protein BGO49_28480 [Planctomycetales bacterium 71-10]|nr:MAG: hypothetical protein BGO49_28480 [Planctomycetales bacterium 71-10]